MNDTTEGRVTGWGGIVLGLLGLIGLPTLSVFVVGLTRPVSLPLWAVLSFMLLLAALALTAFTRFRAAAVSTAHAQEAERTDWQQTAEQMANDYNELSDRCRRLNAARQSEAELVFEDGAYFRKTDVERKQPFCRVCWDTEEKLITVVEDSEWDDIAREWCRVYRCPVCQKAHSAQVVFPRPKPVDDLDGEEIPF